MGIFSKKVNCINCNQEGAKIQIFNGLICKDCYNKSIDFLSTNVDISQRRVKEIKDAIDRYNLNQEEIKSFTGTRKIGTFIEIDEEHGYWQILDNFGKRINNPMIYSIGDINRFELVEDGVVIAKGGVGHPPVEKIEGQSKTTFINSLVLRVYTDNRNKSNGEIKIVASDLNIHSRLYNSIFANVKELVDFLESGVNVSRNSITTQYSDEISAVDEILKVQGLLDSGIITQEEFDKIQSRILGF